MCTRKSRIIIHRQRRETTSRICVELFHEHTGKSFLPFTRRPRLSFTRIRLTIKLQLRCIEKTQVCSILIQYRSTFSIFELKVRLSTDERGYPRECGANDGAGVITRENQEPISIYQHQFTAFCIRLSPYYISITI